MEYLDLNDRKKARAKKELNKEYDAEVFQPIQESIEEQLAKRRCYFHP